MTALYRMAEKANKYNKAKPDYISNQSCLTNFRRHFSGRLVLFGDRLKESKAIAIAESNELIETKAHGNAQTFNEVLDYALNKLKDSEVVYFVEDDYLHRSRLTAQIIAEGLERVDYVSLYDHPDKYVPGRNQPYVFYTERTHWRTCDSTTMTFACKVATIREDQAVFRKYTQGDHPHDYYIWRELLEGNKRILATPIPGYATHGETAYLSPTLQWEPLTRS